MKYYSVPQAAEMLGLSERAVHKRCLKDKIWKKSNKYQITEENIQSWRKDIQANTLLQKRIANAELEKEIARLKHELKQYELEDNERLEVFTEESYSLFEQRLKEWNEQRTLIAHQEEIFNIQLASKTEQLEHYKNQFEYQKKQSDKILEMHQKLIDTIDKQLKNTIQRTIIEAREKEVIGLNWKPKK